MDSCCWAGDTLSPCAFCRRIEPHHAYEPQPLRWWGNPHAYPRQYHTPQILARSAPPLAGPPPAHNSFAALAGKSRSGRLPAPEVQAPPTLDDMLVACAFQAEREQRALLGGSGAAGGGRLRGQDFLQFVKGSSRAKGKGSGRTGRDKPSAGQEQQLGRGIDVVLGTSMKRALGHERKGSSPAHTQRLAGGWGLQAAAGVAEGGRGGEAGLSQEASGGAALEAGGSTGSEQRGSNCAGLSVQRGHSCTGSGPFGEPATQPHNPAGLAAPLGSSMGPAADAAGPPVGSAACLDLAGPAWTAQAAAADAVAWGEVRPSTPAKRGRACFAFWRARGAATLELGQGWCRAATMPCCLSLWFGCGCGCASWHGRVQAGWHRRLSHCRRGALWQGGSLANRHGRLSHCPIVPLSHGGSLANRGG